VGQFAKPLTTKATKERIVFFARLEGQRGTRLPANLVAAVFVDKDRCATQNQVQQ
jgi:hypothetical protein